MCAKGKECYIKIEDRTSGEFYNTPEIKGWRFRTDLGQHSSNK